MAHNETTHWAMYGRVYVSCTKSTSRVPSADTQEHITDAVSWMIQIKEQEAALQTADQWTLACPLPWGGVGSGWLGCPSIRLVLD